MILFVIPHGRIDTGLQKNLMALKECLNGLSDFTCAMVFNKVPTNAELNEDCPPKTLQDLQAEAIKNFREKLEQRGLANNIFIQRGDPDKLSEAIKTIYAFISVSTTVPKEGLRTWTETLSHYEGILNGTISAFDAAQSEIIRIKSRLNTLRVDQSALEKSIKSTKTLDNFTKYGSHLSVW